MTRILGASGTLGVGAALLALALGAGKVVVAARDIAALERLKAQDPHRIETVQITSETVSTEVLELIPSGADVLLTLWVQKRRQRCLWTPSKLWFVEGGFSRLAEWQGPFPLSRMLSCVLNFITSLLVVYNR